MSDLLPNTTVCMRIEEASTSEFTDDVLGNCVECRLPIRWRSHNPPGPKICTVCFKGKNREGVEFVVTQTTIQEIAEILAKKP